MKLERFAYVFIEASLFCTTIKWNESKFVEPIMPDTSSIACPRALLLDWEFLASAC